MALAPLPHVAKYEPPPTAKAKGKDSRAANTYKEMLRHSLCLFAKDILKMELAPHFMEWDSLIQTTDRLAIIAARDHGKSAFFSYAYPIWRVWADPGCQVYIFSKTLDQAMEHLDRIIYGQDNLVGLIDHPGLRHLLPEHSRAGKRERLKRTDVRFTNGSRIRALGYGKAIRGAHPKYVVLDDPLNDEDLWSEVQRRKHIEYFKSAIVNLVPRHGQLCAVGTPYHALDLWGFLHENKRYTFRKYPAIIRSNGTERALFPWRWTLAELHQKREEIGPIAFAREIMCEAVTDDVAIFPSYLFTSARDRTLTLRPSQETLRVRGWSVYFGVDIARSASVGADFFVIFVIGVDAATGERTILDIVREKGLSFNKQLDLIKAKAQQYGPSLVHIEANAMQQIWTDETKRNTDIPVQPFVTTAQNKYPLDKGVPGLRILLENEKVVIPYGDEYSRAQTDAWVSEATQFGFIDGKLQGIGSHDDTVMAWWLAEEAARKGGFSFTFGDKELETDGETDEDAKIDWEKELLGTDDEMEGLLRDL